MVSEGLDFLKEKVLMFDLQGLPNQRSNLGLVEHLQISVADLEGAQNPITQCAVADVQWNIHKFFTALDAS